MENEELSVIVWCWPNPQANITQLRLVRVDTSEDVLLKNGSFLLRISIDANTSVVRCFIRHIASGSEAYMQGGPKLRTFIKTCLLDARPPGRDAPETSGM